ncbi:unnamed protein product, partial [Iphiclides podalirius]
MALTHLHLAILVGLSFVCPSYAAANASSAVPAIKTLIDPKRRNDLVDEAFLEQKDILLDMLETKLKEVRDKKKKKGDNVNSNYSNNADTVKCEPLPKNVDLNLNAHGISAIGEAYVKLKFGNTGNGTLNLDATGISNIGQTHVELGVGDGSVHIPGLNNIFVGPSFLKKACETVKQPNTTSSTIETNTGNGSESRAAAAAAAAAEALGGGGRRGPPPLLRSRTLPAIIAPGFSILHAQIDPQRCNGNE